MSLQDLPSSQLGSDSTIGPRDVPSPAPVVPTLSALSTTAVTSTGATPSTVVAAQTSYTSTLSSASSSGFTSSSSSNSAAAAAATTSIGDSQGGSSDGSRSTIIILSTVLSTIGLIILAGGIWACLRYRRRRSRLFGRGITPIGDDEIETWKGHRNEKGLGDGNQRHAAPPFSSSDPNSRGHQKQESTSSTKKPPSVIVYARRSEEQWARSPSTPGHYGQSSWDGGKTSFDKELPFTPIHARAPNAREGLTDEAIPGDVPFVQSPKRQGSRLYKPPRAPPHAHTRHKSSRSSSSLHRLGDGVRYSDVDEYRYSHEGYQNRSRGCSVSSPPPPRLSLSRDWPDGNGGLSPRPLVRPDEIGRAIG
ncbi:hypothetical protein M406DRAFT_107730 [Cryphonectria parasitica EP155]|uniref:Uncharacterized protein n=1 Tax=Cryphonectria parasitica (strain ATCC 38755 / EP155) TaxID=660469 RepID=A0A9P5CT78_CRYP1|nr:uncharacterized protein M406DRAFT_107730 [Cryphonectria parasitica EP155]KAF3769131.1 hypothetical protein M406DRAFT_107730 [Cryphonectria parasitica EP155]